MCFTQNQGNSALVTKESKMTKKYIDMLNENDLIKLVKSMKSPWGEAEFTNSRGDVYQVLGSEDNPVAPIDLGKIEVKLVRRVYRNQEKDSAQ